MPESIADRVCRLLLRKSRIVATVAVVAATLVWLVHDRHRAASLVWLIYCFARPPPVLWDYIHSRADASSGVWGYGRAVHPELICYIETHYAGYDSLLDVASNLGIMLARLQHTNPNASHVGTDISSQMVASTQRRCPSCSAHQFDLHRLLDDESFEPGRNGVPEAADLVLVSDVLCYLAWGGWPPALLQKRGLVPTGTLRTSQSLFFRRLRSMARVEVVFSTHQHNPVVMDAFATNDIRPLHGVYSAPGTAPPLKTRKGAKHVTKAWWLRHVAEQRAIRQRFRHCLNSSVSIQ